MKQEDRRQALVPIPSNFGRGLRPSFAVSKKSKGSSKVTVQSGWVMEDCLHHMETFSIRNAGPLFEEARVKAIMPEKELASPAVVRSVSRLAVLGHMYKRMQAAAWFVTRWGLQNVVTEEDGPERKAQRGAKARRPGQRGANASGMGGAAVATDSWAVRRLTLRTLPAARAFSEASHTAARVASWNASLTWRNSALTVAVVGQGTDR
eukprot:jgi/Tetstr1/442663/TSEL_030757.t1